MSIAPRCDLAQFIGEIVTVAGQAGRYDRVRSVMQ